MRLLVLSSWWPFPADNGSRLRAFHLLRRLARGHRITLLAFGAPRDPDEIEPLRGFCERIEVVTPPRLEDGRLGVRGLLSPMPRYHVQTDSAEMRSLLIAHAPAHDAALGLQLGAARYLVDVPGIPRVFEEVEVTVPRQRYGEALTLGPRLRHGLTWWKSQRFVRSVVDSVDRATVVSTLEREALAAIGCDIGRVEVVPNGVEATISLREAPHSSRLIYPGSVLFDANLDAVRYFVREVFPRIRQARPDATFWVTGATDGIDLSDLEQPGVTFTGRLPEVDSIVASSAACVVPLRLGGGTRLKVLQAMALGVPVVSTPKGIEGLDVEPERHVLVGASAAELATQTLRILDDAAVGRRIATRALRLVREQHDWDPIAESLDRVIHDAVRAHSSLRGRPTGAAPVPSFR